MCGMSIKSISNMTNTTIDKIVRKIPAATVKKEGVLKAIKWTSDHLAAPHNNRLILGATAIIMQPLIDLYNKNVDEKTRKVSVARTLAKIIAGTTTGYFIRYACLKGIEYMTKEPIINNSGKIINKLQSAIFPKGVKVTIDGLKHYKNAIGTIAGLGVMLFTNFLIDAPLTKLLTNKFMKKLDIKNNAVIKNPYLDCPRMDIFTGKTNKGGE